MMESVKESEHKDLHREEEKLVIRIDVLNYDDGLYLAAIKLRLHSSMGQRKRKRKT